jgi:hypothetical protein
MDRPILTSTFLLTLLLAIGLFFFIRASVKDRTQAITLQMDRSETSLLEQLQAHFTARSYRVASVEPDQGQMTFSGFVSPSLPLAIFLSVLAGVGLFCLALVLGMAAPVLNPAVLGLPLLSPIAGWFYWQRAGRQEEVTLKVMEPQSGQADQGTVRITAHRDELIALQAALPLELLSE